MELTVTNRSRAWPKAEKTGKTCRKAVTEACLWNRRHACLEVCVANTSRWSEAESRWPVLKAVRTIGSVWSFESMRDRPLYSSGFFCYRKYPYSSFFERLRRKTEENRSGKRPILRNRPFCNDYTDKMEKSDGVNEIFGLITEKTGRIAAVTGHYSP